MKKILTAMTLFFVLTNVHAQTNKGDIMIGGDVRINTTKSNQEFTVQPTAGYFFAKSFVAGSELKTSFTKFGDQKTTSFGAGPFARYYFNLKNSSFKPLVHSSFTFETATTRVLNSKFRSTVTSLFIGGGGAYFLNENVALEVIAGYNRSKYENVDSEGGFAFRLGFQIHLLGSEVRTINRGRDL
jgi:hypothetical protein